MSSLETRCRLTKSERLQTNPNDKKSFGVCSGSIVRLTNEYQTFAGSRPEI